MTDERIAEALARAGEYAGEWPQPEYRQAITGWASAIQALRSHGAEVEDRGWHIRECALAFDWSHYEIESPCTCEIERKAIATFCDAMLGGDDEQH